MEFWIEPERRAEIKELTRCRGRKDTAYLQAKGRRHHATARVSISQRQKTTAKNHQDIFNHQERCQSGRDKK